MSHEIPLNDENDVPVVRVVWNGDLYQGDAQVQAITGYEDIATNLRAMILSRQDLRELRFRSEGDLFWVRGWHGYEGTVGALRIIAPSMQLHVGHIAGDTPALGAGRTDEIAFNYDQGGIE